MNITEHGDFMPFGSPAILDEWGRRKIDGLVEDGVGIIVSEIIISLSDSGVGFDVSTLIADVPSFDSGEGIDSLSALLATISLTDSGIGAEVSTITIPMLDSGVGADSLSTLSVSILVPDSGIGADYSSILASILVSDFGAGIDVVSLLANIITLDSGVGIDELSRLIVHIFDSGIGIDTVLIQVLISALDSGIGADVISDFIAKITLLDSGIGVDTLSALLANILTSDLGMGIDEWSRKILVGYVKIGDIILDALAFIKRWEGSRDEYDLDIILYGDSATVKQKELELIEQAKYAGQLNLLEPPFVARVWQDRSPNEENKIFIILQELGVMGYFLQREFSSEIMFSTMRRVRFRLVKV